MKKIKQYFIKHEAQLQFLMFFCFSFCAMIAQLLSRFIFDICFENLSTTVTIWPFEKQAIGSFLAFLLSNIIAKVISYITNRKKTFSADNNVKSSIVIYTIMVIAFIIIETIIGTPIQNWLYTFFNGQYSGAELTTSTAVDSSLYQICGTLAQVLYGIVDGLIIFFMDKYVIMTKKNK